MIDLFGWAEEIRELAKNGELGSEKLITLLSKIITTSLDEGRRGCIVEIKNYLGIPLTEQDIGQSA